MARIKKRQQYILLVSGTIIVATLAVAAVWAQRHDLRRSIERSTLPEAVEYEEVASTTTTPTTQPPQATQPLTTAPVTELPAEINLAIPFTPQAPHANWDLPYKEFCEEASVLMAMSYLNKQSIATPDIADQRMEEIRAFEEARFGYYEDTTAAETATIIREHYKFPNVELVENPTANDIKEALAAGKPVIVPAAGRMLGNPYFQTPGPLYHMLVIKGYTANGKFIVNDPGTRRGADFLYDESVIMNAMHDWRSDAKIELGRKVIIVVG